MRNIVLFRTALREPTVPKTPSGRSGLQEPPHQHPLQGSRILSAGALRRSSLGLATPDGAP